MAPKKVVSSDQATASPTITSPVVKTTSGNELVLAFVSIDGPNGVTQKVSKVTGGGLTTDGVGPHSDYLSDFPYLGQPH